MNVKVHKINAQVRGVFFVVSIVTLWSLQTILPAYASHKTTCPVYTPQIAGYNCVQFCAVHDYETAYPEYWANAGSSVSASGTCTTPSNTALTLVHVVMDDGGPVSINGASIPVYDSQGRPYTQTGPTCEIKNNSFWGNSYSYNVSWTSYNSVCAGVGADVRFYFYQSICSANTGNACTSSANSCGQTNSGTIQCDGSCSASTPANPPGYGNACTSSANSCGQTNSGTIQCNGSCSATMPPDSSCPAPTANISASSNPVSYGGSSTISWSSTNSSSCSVPGIGSGLSGSGSTGALTSNQTYTVTCAGLNGSQVSNSVTVIVSAPTVDIKANGSDNPPPIPWNSSANLTWTSTNAGSCNASGDWVVSGGKPLSGSESTGNLTQVKTYTFTLTCSGNGNSTDSVSINVSAPVPDDPSNVTVTQPNYCVSGPAVTVGWTYSDPSGSPQQSYEIEIDDAPYNFASPVFNPGKESGSSNSRFTGQGVLQFNTTYRARVRVWNGYDQVSGWTNSPNFTTPPYAYPQTSFYYTANGIVNNPSPPLSKPVQFTDQTVFSGPMAGRRWNWSFGDGNSSTSQNPAHTYGAEGTYYVILIATDNANQSCPSTSPSSPGPLIIQKPIPLWREIAPR